MRTANDLLSTYQHIIESLTLTTAASGTFDVTVDGENLFSKKSLGRHAQDGEVLELFTRRWAEGVRPYGE